MMKSLFCRFSLSLERLKDIPLLLIRIILAYGFLQPALMKWNDIHAIGQWFGSLGIPAPYLSAYLAAATEALGVILLVFGLGTRFIAFPLVVILLVAIKTVHGSNGFEAGNNGFEIPLYYILFLLVLIVNGSGKYSVDYLVGRKRRRQAPPPLVTGKTS